MVFIIDYHKKLPPRDLGTVTPLNFSVPDVDVSINQIAEHYKDSIVDWLDGLTVDVGDWWFNLRPSNTEPLLRLNIEANNNKICVKAIEEVRTLLSQ